MPHSDSETPQEEKTAEPTLFDKLAAEKARRRQETAELIAKGLLTPEEAQFRNAPIKGNVEIVDLWDAIQRYTSPRKKTRKPD